MNNREWRLKIESILLRIDIINKVMADGKDLSFMLADAEYDLRMCCTKRGKYREIPTYHQYTERRIIRSDYDGYVEKIVFKEGMNHWTKEEMEEMFEENYTMETNSPYDCTGLAFTSWFSVVKLANRWVAFHSVGIDC